MQGHIVSGLLLISLAGCFWHSPLLGQEINYWRTLADVTYQEKKNEAGYTIQYPVFGNRVKKVDGDEIVLKGYIVPLQELRGQNFFVLSSLPFNVCFFCGGAGPETVIEVNTKQPIPFTEKAVKISGQFRLNPDDPDHMMYIMDGAVLVE